MRITFNLQVMFILILTSLLPVGTQCTSSDLTRWKTVKPLFISLPSNSFPSNLSRVCDYKNT